MKYPIFLTVDEFDVILDALADYAEEDVVDDDYPSKEELNDIQMRIASARRDLYRRVAKKDQLCADEEFNLQIKELFDKTDEYENN